MTDNGKPFFAPDNDLAEPELETIDGADLLRVTYAEPRFVIEHMVAERGITLISLPRGGPGSRQATWHFERRYREDYGRPRTKPGNPTSKSRSSADCRNTYDNAHGHGSRHTEAPANVGTRRGSGAGRGGPASGIPASPRRQGAAMHREC